MTFWTTTRLLMLLMLIAIASALAINVGQSWMTALAITVSALGGISIARQGLAEALSKTRNDSELTQRRLLFRGRAEGYQDVINAIDTPILLIRNARVAFANPSATQILGEHIVDQDVRIAIRHPAAAERLANPQAEHRGDPVLLVGVGTMDQRWEMRVQTLDDGLKLVALSDQSSRYAAEKMRTDFVANASHELRTPLATIKGGIETLENPAAGGDEATRTRFLTLIFEEAERMQRLIEDLMSLSRIEAEKYQIPEERVDLLGLTQEVEAFFIRNRGRKKGDIIIETPKDLPEVRGDSSQLSQLLHNLIGNALKYGRKGAPVRVVMEPNRNRTMLSLSVIDEGDGIEADHIPRLTERFYRVDKGRSRSVGGTGLGLSIVKHITERHGGRLDINSTIGKGTTVQVSLPIAKTIV